MRHVISQIIKTKFIICSVGNVRIIRFFSSFRIGLVVIDTIYSQTVKLEKRCFPSAITFSQVVIDRDQMNSVSGQSI